MRLKDVLVLCVAAACASCGGNNPPAPQQKTGQMPTQQAQASPAPSSKSAANPSGAANTLAGAPADAQWTIFVQAVRGPTHIAESKRLKDHLMAQAGGLKQWHIVHGETESTLYHGYYSTISGNSPEAQRAEAHLKQIKDIRDSLTNRRIFPQAIPVALSTADPDAPDEWDLTSSGGFYTLEIATYAGHGRKQAAVESVREARAQGVEAYYYHGETSSSVCIGAWPREAAEQAAPVKNDRANRPIVVSAGAPNEALEETIVDAVAQKDDEVESVTRKHAMRLTSQFIPKDPTMIAAMKRFPHRYVDGELYSSRMIDPQTKQPVLVPDQSYIVVIPKRTANILRQDVTQAQPDPRRQQDFGAAVYGQPGDPPTTHEPPRRGKLRSIGE